MCRRRIIQKHTVTHLFLIECLIILHCRRLNTVMIRMIGLDHCLSRFFPPSSPADCLTEKLKGTFRTSIILCIQRKIRCYYSHECDIRKIMPLNDHLCSDQYICLMSSKSCKDLFIAALGSCCIKIHSESPDFWKIFPHYLLDLLCSCLKSANIRRSAHRAYPGFSCLISTVMT